MSKAIGKVVRLARVLCEVAPSQSEKLRMRSTLANRPLVKHDNLVGVPHCRQTMSDDKRGPTAAQEFKRALN